MLKSFSSSIALATALAVALPSVARAQEGGAPVGDSLLGGDIVVTAQKRSQSVQDVGIAITTYSGDQLRALGVSDSTNLAALSPGVHISGNLAGQNTQLTIRGVTQNDFNDIVEAPNAAYLMINAGLTWRTLDRNWELGFDIKNLTDRRVGIQGFDLATFCGCNEVSYKPPRMFALRVHRSF